MKKLQFIFILTSLCLLACCTPFNVQTAGDGTASSTFEGTVDYDTYFTGERLRVDFVLAGDKQTETAYLQEMHCESVWAGSPNGLIDKFGYGEYYFEAFAGDNLIYSKGFSTYFQEWRTTAQASELAMAVNQTVWMPCPKQPVKLVLYRRQKVDNRFIPIFEGTVDPADKLIRHQKENDYKLVALQHNGDYAHKVDLLFAAEAYTADQMDKFEADARRFMEYLFSMEPYKSRRDDFNVWALESVSLQSGVDKPHWDEWNNTVCESNFYTFYIDRYLTISDHKRIASTVSGAPFDALFIIANEQKYGGGGIYGSYAMGTCDDSLSEVVFIHEFGHSFAGLGDEYYDSEVAYEDYYPSHLEPWEPNITTLVDFDSKWADIVPEGVPVPTPATEENSRTVGVYEGAGYMTYGCYRPYVECRMLNNTAPAFCPVCKRAIGRMIDFYVK